MNAGPMLGNVFLDQLLGLQRDGERRVFFRTSLKVKQRRLTQLVMIFAYGQKFIFQSGSGSQWWSLMPSKLPGTACGDHTIDLADCLENGVTSEAMPAVLSWLHI